MAVETPPFADDFPCCVWFAEATHQKHFIQIIQFLESGQTANISETLRQVPCRNLQSCWLQRNLKRPWLLEVKSKPHKISSFWCFSTLYDWRLSQTCKLILVLQEKSHAFAGGQPNFHTFAGKYVLLCAGKYMQCDGNAMQFIVMFWIKFSCFCVMMCGSGRWCQPSFLCYSVGIIIPNTVCCLYLYVHCTLMYSLGNQTWLRKPTWPHGASEKPGTRYPRLAG